MAAEEGPLPLQSSANSLSTYDDDSSVPESPLTPVTPGSPFDSPVCQKLSQLLLEQAAAPGQRPDLSWLVFRKYNQEDTWGTLSPRDFNRMVRDLGYDLSDNQMSLALSLMDQNADGSIQYGEFYRIWRNSSRFKCLQFTPSEEEVLTKSMEYFQFFDSNKDGALDKAEFQVFYQSLLKEGLTDQPEHVLFQELDVANDGVVSFAEFAAWLQRTGSIAVRALRDVA